MLINYIFAVAVYNLFPPLEQFLMPFRQKSRVKELDEPVFKNLFVIEDKQCPSYGLTG